MARRIVGQLLAEDPNNAEARELLDGWRGRSGRPQAVEPQEAAALPTAAAADELAGRFREVLAPSVSPNRQAIRRLERWLERVQRAARA